MDPRGEKSLYTNKGPPKFWNRKLRMVINCLNHLSFSLLALIWASLASSNQARSKEVCLHIDFLFFNGYTHVASVAAFATISFILTDTLIGA